MIWPGRALALLRIAAGYMFLMHGTGRLLHVPQLAGYEAVQLVLLAGFASVLELAGGSRPHGATAVPQQERARLPELAQQIEVPGVCSSRSGPTQRFAARAYHAAAKGTAVASDKFPLRPEGWSARYDRGEHEELAWHLWAESLAVRAQAMAQPVTGWVMPEEVEPGHDKPESSEFSGSQPSSDDRLFE